MKIILKFLIVISVLLFSVFIGYSINKSDENILGNNKPSTENTVKTYEYKHYMTFNPEEKYVKHIGRSAYDDNCLWFSMSGSGIEFITSSDSVDFTLICENAYSLYSSHKPRVAVYINDEIYYDDTLKEYETTVSLDISRHIGDKIVKVIKLSESMYSSCGIRDIKVYDNKDISPTDYNDLKIEFIGDSITAGYGLDETGINAVFSTKTENFTKTYAYLAAKTLKADYSTIAFSGYGVLAGQYKTDCVVSKYYENSLTNKSFSSPYPLTKWDFSKFSPDVVVINLGVNDVGYCSSRSRLTEFTEAYKKLIGLIRWHNKNAHILCVLGEINNSLYPNIENAVMEYINETGDNKVYCDTLDFEMRNYLSVIDGHPSSESNIIAGKNLSYMIQDIINGNFVSSYERVVSEYNE